MLVWENQIYSFVIAPIEGEVYVNAYGMDITEQKRVEIELKKHRDHLEYLVGVRIKELNCFLNKKNPPATK